MRTILKNDFLRLLTKKSLIITMLIMTAGAIAAALFFSTRTATVANLAVISTGARPDLDIPSLKVTVVSEEPPQSELVSGHYDAVLYEQSDGTFRIRTLKGKDTRAAISQLLLTGRLPDSFRDDQRGTGAMVIGFLLMFILMEGARMICMYAEDKEHKQITRVISSPLSLSRYLAAHSLFCFISLYLPTLGMLGLLKLFTGINLGFAFWQYAALLALLCAFATALALFINSLTAKSDNASMAASAIIIMTSILAGSFYSFEKGNDLLARLITLLPQKACLNIAEQLERGMPAASYRVPLLYLIILIVLLFGLAILKTRKDYIQSR